MSIYLLDADILSVDLAIIKSSTDDDLVKLFCNNAIYYEKGLPRLNMEFIQKFRESHKDVFDLVIRKTKTRIV